MMKKTNTVVLSGGFTPIGKDGVMRNLDSYRIDFSIESLKQMVGRTFKIIDITISYNDIDNAIMLEIEESV